ncbi:hypothetical protein ACLQ2V_15535 [Micromonospora sp. DT233]
MPRHRVAAPAVPARSVGTGSGAAADEPYGPAGNAVAALGAL